MFAGIQFLTLARLHLSWFPGLVPASAYPGILSHLFETIAGLAPWQIPRW